MTPWLLMWSSFLSDFSSALQSSGHALALAKRLLCPTEGQGQVRPGEGSDHREFFPVNTSSEWWGCSAWRREGSGDTAFQYIKGPTRALERDLGQGHVVMEHGSWLPFESRVRY